MDATAPDGMAGSGAEAPWPQPEPLVTARNRGDGRRRTGLEGDARHEPDRAAARRVLDPLQRVRRVPRHLRRELPPPHRRRHRPGRQPPPRPQDRLPHCRGERPGAGVRGRAPAAEVRPHPAERPSGGVRGGARTIRRVRPFLPAGLEQPVRAPLRSPRRPGGTRAQRPCRERRPGQPARRVVVAGADEEPGAAARHEGDLGSGQGGQQPDRGPVRRRVRLGAAARAARGRSWRSARRCCRRAISRWRRSCPPR